MLTQLFLAIDVVYPVTMAGRPPAVTDYEIIQAVGDVVHTTAQPVATTAEIAEHLPIKREGLSRRLIDLADIGVIEQKTVGISYVWWLPPETDAIRLGPEGRIPKSTGANRDESTNRFKSASVVASREIIDHFFTTGLSQFELELGAIARVDPSTDYFEVEAVSDIWDGFEPGTEYNLSETYCTMATESHGPASITNPNNSAVADRLVHRKLGFKSYLGTRLSFEDGPDRTFFFISRLPQKTPFTEKEYAYHEILAQGIQANLDPNNQSVSVS